MRNWKELGEVPDSDDESLDNPESQDEIHEEQPVANQNVDDIQPAPKQHDVWDIPPSPKEQGQDQVPRGVDGEKPTCAEPAAPKSSVDDICDLPVVPPEVVEQTTSHDLDRQPPEPADFDGPPFSPLSSPPSDIDDIDDIDELGILPSAPATVGLRDRTVGNNGTTTATRPSITFEEDEISTPYVTITAPLPGRPVSRMSPSTPASTTSERSPLVAHLADATTSDPASDWAEAPASGRRSLRPRKPIQQHPYLLESVQYAHVMKSHGVRPVRVVIPEASPVRRAGDDDSQDREFEGQSSEERMDERPADMTDESQPILFDDLDNDRDELGFSPSPPRTSPRNMLQNSSQRSDADRTDNTSVLEDDFPTIEELVRRPSKPKARTLKRQLSAKLLPKSKRANRRLMSSAEPSSPPVGGYRHVSLDPPSSPAASGPVAPSQDLGVGGTPGFSHGSHAITTAPLAAPLRRDPSTSSRLRPPVVDLTAHGGDDDSSGSEMSSSSSGSKSGSEVVRRNGKRIRDKEA
ncbi:hypothetical protein NKR19_g3915 [Coniochaeta hoffmannii]|uniref:Uncharacterized protein n=1 Tax=Coniochaeta hoffmannii TaxID=91930 RepID=A0AA38VQ94_9PEZI|nr:hypothetical protein NKR19_g3915 [Coniochaeta hoffmannii]